MKLFFNIILIISTLSLNAQEFTFFEQLVDLGGSKIIHADLNGDGKLDFVTEYNYNWDSYVGLTTDQGVDFKIFSEGVVLEYLNVIDLDLDGDNDIIGSATSDHKTIIFINDGNGNFEKIETDFPPYYGIVFDDVDEDGTPELVLAHYKEIAIISVPELTIEFTITDEAWGFSPSCMRYLDYNQDGTLELIVLNNQADFFMFNKTGEQEYTKTVITKNHYGTHGFYISDLNQDNQLDFITYGYDVAGVLMNTGNNTFNEISIPGSEDVVSWVTLGDLDNDNIDEILMLEGHFLREITSIAKFNTNSGTFDVTNLTSDYSNTNKGGIADLNNDGLMDFYFFSSHPSKKFVIALQSDIMFKDNDNDGFTEDVDCDDSNPDIYPGAEEICDDLDNNCNGQIDENQTFLSWWIDKDNDGFGEGPKENRIVDCKQPDGYVQNYDDCDDSNPNINPNAEDIPDNGIDENCDGMDSTTGIYEIENSKVHIYPNPANSVINIDITGQLNYNISLFNMLGKLVYSAKNQSSININSIPKGTYILELKDTKTNKKIIEKIVIER